MDGKNTEDPAHAAGYLTVPTIGFWTLSLATQTMRWSPELSQIYDLPHEDEVPMHHGAPRVAARYWDEVKAAFQGCIEAGVGYDLEVQIAFEDGERRWLRMIGEPLRNELGDIIGARGAVHDIDKYRREAARRERALAAVASRRDEVVLFVDAEGELLFAVPESPFEDFDPEEVIEAVRAELSPETSFADLRDADSVELEVELDDTMFAVLHGDEEGVVVHLKKADDARD